MATIFISYSRDDDQKARDLAWEIEARGADAWWDREIISGERYIETILRQAGQADHFVLLLSESSVRSQWVAFEVGAARAREFSTGNDFLKIAKIDDCEIPGFLGERNATQWNDLPSLMRSLGLPVDIDYKPPAGADDASLMVFKAGGQWMELVISHRGLECVLVDVGEQRSRMQWQMTREEVNGLTSGSIDIQPPREDRSWAVFSIGPKREWRWSPTLFARSDGPPPEERFKQALEKHLKNLVEGRI